MITKSNKAAIPTSIDQLELKLNEKFALYYIQQSPDISNDQLARLLGMSPRGAQSMLRRLRRSGYIANVGKGRARRIALMFHTEQHTECEV